jgi:TPR repeat protein
MRRSIIAASSGLLGLAVLSLTGLGLPALAAATSDIDTDLLTGRRAYMAGDYPAAMAQLRPLAEYSNDPTAQYIVGTMYSHGEGVARDPREAARWYAAAARQGNADAAFALGFLLYYGEGEGPRAVPADPASAAKWMVQAAQRSNPSAQYFLGHMFLTGNGAAQDAAAARYWLTEAANGGVVGAQFELGVLLARDQSYQSTIEAYKWFDIAARARYPAAEQNRAVMAQRLNGPDLQRATEMANAWRPR